MKNIIVKSGIVLPISVILLVIFQLTGITAYSQSKSIFPLKAGKTYRIEYNIVGGLIKIVTPPTSDGWANVNILEGFTEVVKDPKAIVGLNINQAILIFPKVRNVSKEYVNVNRDAIVTDIENLAADAYQFKIRPTSMGGGNGTYVGFTINAAGMWGTKNPNAVYEIVLATDTKIKLRATSILYPNATVEVVYDENGMVTEGPNTTGF